MKSQHFHRMSSLAPGALELEGGRSLRRTSEATAGILVACDADDILPFKLAQEFGDIARIRQVTGYHGLLTGLATATARTPPFALVVLAGSVWPACASSVASFLARTSSEVRADVLHLSTAGRIERYRDGKRDLVEHGLARDRARAATILAGDALAAFRRSGWTAAPGPLRLAA